MNKISLFTICLSFALLFTQDTYSYKLQSSRELGRDEAKNQNIIVRCTTDTGSLSNETCQLRRFANCKVASNGKKNCSGWKPWHDIRNPGAEFGDWRGAADACCRRKGLR
ncbi:MAG: hypothetical protein FWG80_01115 [Alphaproteobacteria bacterium]|nr:hypothetical protein [Alphaproteobacteria bacterium]